MSGSWTQRYTAEQKHALYRMRTEQREPGTDRPLTFPHIVEKLKTEGGYGCDPFEMPLNSAKAIFYAERRRVQLEPRTVNSERPANEAAQHTIGRLQVALDRSLDWYLREHRGKKKPPDPLQIGKFAQAQRELLRTAKEAGAVPAPDPPQPENPTKDQEPEQTTADLIRQRAARETPEHPAPQATQPRTQDSGEQPPHPEPRTPNGQQTTTPRSNTNQEPPADQQTAGRSGRGGRAIRGLPPELGGPLARG